MSQARHQAIKDVADRGAAYGIPGIAVDGNDVMAVNEAAAEAVARARKGQGPTLLECKTYRWRGHFEGDPGNYKPKEEQEAWLKKDPIPRFKTFLLENKILTAEEIAALTSRSRTRWRRLSALPTKALIPLWRPWFRIFIPTSLRRYVPDEEDELCGSHPGGYEHPDA